MKKMFVLVLLVPILTIALISCDADIRSNIAGFMGGLGGNVYVDNEWVEPNKADAEAAVATITTLGTAGSTTTATASSNATMFGISDVDLSGLSGDTTILAPQATVAQTELKDSLATALASPTQTKTLLQNLSQPASTEQITAAVGTVTVFNAAISALQSELPPGNELANTIAELALPAITSSDELTQGDILVLQMMTNLISNTVATLNTVSNNNLGSLTDAQLQDNQTQVLSIVDDALFTAQIAEQLSGSATIDFSGQLDLASLLENLNKGSKTSRGAIELTDAGDFIGTLNNIIPDLVDLLGVKDGAYSKADYQKFILNQRAYRAAIEHALSFAKKGNLTSAQLQNRGVSFDTSTLIKYIYAVLMTEHHGYWESKGFTEITDPRPEEIILAYLNANPKLAAGTLTVSDSITAPEITGFDYDGFPAHLHGKGSDYLKAIINNLIAINNVGGIAQLTEALEDFLDEDFDDWFADLV